MTKDEGNAVIEQEGRLGGCLLWFFWGVSISFMTILSIVLLVLLAASVSLNIYLGWELSGLELSVSRPGTQPLEAPVALIPTNVLAVIPTNTPVPPATETPTLAPIISPVVEQMSTVAAIVTEIASASQPVRTPIPVLTPTPLGALSSIGTAVAIATPDSETASSKPEAVEAADSFAPPESSTVAPTEAPTTEETAVTASKSGEFEPYSSSNTYTLIPIDGERDRRPGEGHGDLNLKLRELEPIEADLSLVDIPGSGIDPSAPNFGDIFEPNFTSAYTVHGWDSDVNCPGELLEEAQLVVVGLETTPGDPVFIPPTSQDIFGGDIFAMVLHASADSLTFAYSRDGTVAHSYAIHYQGLQTDPNLLALYRESRGNELPGLTLDTPVGIATDELIVAIRDKGVFMDARSNKDWWE